MTEPFVRPDVRAFLDWINGIDGPRLPDVTPAEGRRMSERLSAACDLPPARLPVMQDLATPCGIGLRLFDPRPARPPGPAMVFFHGGGWVLGSLDTYAGLCAEIARLLDMPLISVDYRLAPEHRWPAAPDDAEAAARWIATAPPELGRDVTGLVLAGDSAGGQLAIITALALRDHPAAVPVRAIWPIYPAVSMGGRFDSIDRFGDGYLLSREDLRWFLAHYGGDPRHWRANPHRREQAGLPPTLVTTAALDPLRDQGIAYVNQLERDGVRVAHHAAEGTIHGFLSLRKALPSAQDDLETALAQLRILLEEDA